MFEAFILAGGRATRMEREKAVIEINGESFIDIAVRNLSGTGADSITVVSGSKSRILQPLFKDLKIIDDISPNLGASGGILTAIENSSSENVFVLACDLPFVTSELIAFLFQRFESGDSDALVPLQPDGYKQPLCAFYRKSKCQVPFKASIGRSEFAPSARDLLEKVTTEYIEFEELAGMNGSSDFFLNINTPMDLEFARKIARAK